MSYVPICVFKTTVKVVPSFLFVVDGSFSGLYVLGVVGSQWTLKKCGTPLEGSCRPLVHSTVWFGEVVSECCLPGHLS